MPVLRSREIPPPPIPSPKTLISSRGNGEVAALVEPSTPNKSIEPLIHQSPHMLSPLQEPSPLAFDSEPSSGPVRRRSLRLASMSNSEPNPRVNGMIGKCEVVEVTGKGIVERRGKRKKGDVLDFEEIEEKGITGRKENDVKSAVGLASDEVRVSNVKECVVGMTLEGKNKEGWIEVGVFDKIDCEGSGRGNKKKGKRWLDSGLDLDVGKETGFEGEAQCLSLRSGARVAKRTREGSSSGVVLSSEREEKVTDEKRRGNRASTDGLVNERKLKVTGKRGIGDRAGTDDGLISERKDKVKDRKGKGVLIDECESDGSKAKIDDDLSVIEMDLSNTRRRLTEQEKGKAILGEDVERALTCLKAVMSSSGIDLNISLVADTNAYQGSSQRSSALGSIPLHGDSVVQDNGSVAGPNSNVNVEHPKSMMDRFKDIARRNASEYAHFSAREEEENHAASNAEREAASELPVQDVEDWPGPFATAMKIIEDREKNLNRQLKNSSSNKICTASILWKPSRGQNHILRNQVVPSLQDLSIRVLAKNVDAISSLERVPDALRHNLSQVLCDSRKMNCHFLHLLVQGSPSEIRLKDCSWLTEEDFAAAFDGCNTDNLTVLQLDQCGRCLTDYRLNAAITAKSLQALTTISLKGACRLSDVGLSALVSFSPSLRSINLSQCSLLTDASINIIADSLGSILRELYLDDCQNLDALGILPALKKLKHLEVLSLAGIDTICDKFVREFIMANGQNMKELILADCTKLTDSSVNAIAESCKGLCVLNLANAYKLTDSGLCHLSNGCQEMQVLKLCGNSFSDEAIAAFLETSGESLRELSLNNLRKVGPNTAISVAKRCRNLQVLDVSWCRNLTDEALGLIADSCSSLRLLKIFGCTQVTKTFLDGHSNECLDVIGLKLTPILDHLKKPDPLQGPLHYSAVPSL